MKSAFPDRIVRRMDSDTMRSPGSHEKVLALFKEGQVEILLGTQMIAKGLDFPARHPGRCRECGHGLALTRLPRRRADVPACGAGGRAHGTGRSAGKGAGPDLLPEAPAIQHAAHHDYLGFVADEIPRRRDHGVPPFGRIVRLIVRGESEKAAWEYIQQLGKMLHMNKDVSVRFPSAPPPPPS